MVDKTINIRQDGNESTQVIPPNVYIPADALEVIIQAFEGPLDLLLYLIRKNKFNVLDIPVAEIAEQYARYIDLMQSIQLELAGEYLAMAATLAQIKSRLLLPPVADDAEDEETDPRAELARQLEEYDRIRQIAAFLESRPRVGRDIFIANAIGPPAPRRDVFETLALVDLIDSFKNVLRIAELSMPIRLQKEPLSVKDRVKLIRARLIESGSLQFNELFDRSEGRAVLVVTFLALLELINSNQIYAVQASSQSPIHIRWNA